MSEEQLKGYECEAGPPQALVSLRVCVFTLFTHLLL